MSSKINHSDFGIWLRNQFLVRQMYSPLGIVFLSALALFAGLMAANGLSLVIFGFAGALIGVLIIYACLFIPLLGFYLTTLVAFFAAYPNHLLNREVPLSTFVEVLVLFLYLGTLANAKADKNQQGSFGKTAISIIVILNVVYFVIELFNPNMLNIFGWFFNCKRYAVYLLMYIIHFKLINTPDRFRYFMKFWIMWSFIAALYGCYQQWVGFLPMELEYLKNDPHEYGLLFQGGVVRKFSFLDGVVTFGILCGSMAVVTLILALNEAKKKRKRQLYFITLILFLGMSYSGTRTTTIMLPAAIALYSLMTIKSKTTLITLLVTFLAAAFIMLAPIENSTINRMRSTFNSKEESLDVRNTNRHYIQPYIYKNPLGGGIATSGVEGMRFNRGHPLAGFPPDSGLLKIALDMGWIGLILAMLMYAVTFYQGIDYYSSMRNEEYKKYVIAIVCSLFSIVVTQYSQVSIGQIPTAFFFYGVMALLKRLKDFDDAERDALRLPGQNLGMAR